MEPAPRQGGDYRGLALISTAVGEMVVPVLVGVWADGRFDSSPMGVLVGGVVGVVGGFIHLVYLSRRKPGADG